MLQHFLSVSIILIVLQELIILPVNSWSGDVAEVKNHSHHRSKRIIGGMVIPDSESYGFLVSIHKRIKNKIQHACGGTYLTNRWILTAAHCACETSELYVYIGGTSLLHSKDNLYKVDKIITKNYNKDTLENDIALLRVTNKYLISRKYLANSIIYHKISLPKKNYTIAEPCMIAGYGDQNFNGDISMKPKVATINLVSYNDCVQKLGYHSAPKGSFTAFCAGGKSTDACQGDSGGPLFCKEHVDSEHFTLAGITSYGISCGVPGIPGVYTNVRHFLPWIESHINKKKDQ